MVRRSLRLLFSIAALALRDLGRSGRAGAGTRGGGWDAGHGVSSPDVVGNVRRAERPGTER